MNDPTPRLGGDLEQARRVQEADERWIAAFNRGDVDAVVALYAPDVVVMPPGEPSLRGRETVRRWLSEFFDRHTARQSLVNDEIVVAGDWAWMRGHFSLLVAARDGTGELRRHGKHLVIWRRQDDGSWRAARDLWNYDAP